MKILVPTDFSECANHAFSAALRICDTPDFSLVLFHNITLPDGWVNIQRGKDELKKAHDYLNNYADDQIQLMVKSAKGKVGTCEGYIGTGDFMNNLSYKVDESNVDLIIMGSHGARPLEEFYIGSNAQKVVRSIEKDVLIIKKPLPERVKSIAFVSDLSIYDRDAFTKCLGYADIFGVEQIHILSVDTDSWYDQPKVIMDAAFDDMVNIADGYHCKTHFYRDYSVNSGVKNFTKEHEIDLLAIANRHTNPLKRFFLGSNVEKLVNRSNVSVLTIDN